MTSCWHCGTDNRETAVFCRGCGLRLDHRACSSCGAEQPTDSRFCDACGATLEPSGAPRPLSETLSAPAAERRLVTVLFADAKGSTELTERIGDEEMYRVIQECVTRMQRVVESHDGTVTQFRGDGVMALFGAPIAIEDAAVRAVLAALEIQASLTAYGHDVKARTGAPCPFRIGVNTGPVVVGRVGEETLVDYTAIGDTANVAARLEQAAGPGEVFVSDTTWRAVRDFVECDEVGELEIRGRRDDVRAHHAVRRRPARSRLDAAAVRGLSPFVGRTDELALLQGLVGRLGEGRGRVVAVAGEAGVGKSRLLRELREGYADDVDWFEGRSSSADRRAPWHLIVDLLRRSLGIEENHVAEDVGRIVDERATGWSDAARPAAAYLKWLLGAPAPEVAALDPRERRAGVLEALVTVLRDAAARRPVVVVLEDLHWADESSEAGVAALANAVADVPVLLLVTYRPDDAPDLGDRPWFTRLALDGLPPEGAGELAGATVGAPLGEAARALIVDHAGGNPLFVEELTSSLIESGALGLRGSALDLLVTTDEIDVPASLHDVVLARIGRLEDEARRALQLASVIGREFTRRILDRIAQMPDRLDAHLAELESLELIRQRSWFPELGYLFKHAVVHDVTYSTLLDERRRELHRIVALATEELYADALGEHCESLARHWLAAGDEARALPHLVEAAERAEAGFSMPRALEAYGQGAAIAERLGQPELAIELRKTRVGALMASSDIHELLREVPRLRATAQSAGDLSAEALAAAYRAWGHHFLHEPDAALESANEGRALGRRAIEAGGTADGFAMASAALGLAHTSRGDLHAFEGIRSEVLSVLDHATVDTPFEWPIQMAIVDHWQGRWASDLTTTAIDPTVPVQWRLWIQWMYGLHAAGAGEFRVALGRFEQGLVLSERTGDVLARARMLNSVGWIHGDLGDIAGAAAWNERSIATVAPVPLPDREIEANARLNLADDAVRDGRLADADAQLADIERTVRHPGPNDYWMLWRYSQRWYCISGELALVRGDASAALALADECLPRSEETGSRKYIVRARRLRARALAALGRDDEARDDVRSALGLARDLGNPPQLWRTLIAAAEIEHDAAFASEAVAVIDGVAAGLGDHPLAATLVASAERALAVDLVDASSPAPASVSSDMVGDVEAGG